jgi:hypothetical protein
MKAKEEIAQWLKPDFLGRDASDMEWKGQKTT